MTKLTIKELKKRLNKIDENKTIEELYFELGQKTLNKLCEGSNFYIKASWDYED